MSGTTSPRSTALSGDAGYAGSPAAYTVAVNDLKLVLGRQFVECGIAESECDMLLSKAHRRDHILQFRQTILEDRFASQEKWGKSVHALSPEALD